MRPPEPNSPSCIHRPEPNVRPDLPLPFFLRSVGHYIRLKKYYERIPAGNKPFVQFFWGVSGEGEFLVDGKTQILHEGDVFYRLPGEAHFQGAHTERWEYRWFTFDGDGAEQFMLSYGYPHACFHAGNCPHELFIRLEELLQEMSPYAWREMVAVASSILARAGGREDRSTREGRIVCEVIRLCSERYGDPDLNINALAEHLGVSRSTLRRVFQEKMHIAPSQYLGRLRIQRALSLLQETILPVSEIAKECGFTDESYFSRVIRRSVGETPKNFRAHG